MEFFWRISKVSFSIFTHFFTFVGTGTGTRDQISNFVGTGTLKSGPGPGLVSGTKSQILSGPGPSSRDRDWYPGLNPKVHRDQDLKVGTGNGTKIQNFDVTGTKVPN